MNHPRPGRKGHRCAYPGMFLVGPTSSPPVIPTMTASCSLSAANRDRRLPQSRNSLEQHRRFGSRCQRGERPDRRPQAVVVPLNQSLRAEKLGKTGSLTFFCRVWVSGMVAFVSFQKPLPYEDRLHVPALYDNWDSFEESQIH